MSDNISRATFFAVGIGAGTFKDTEKNETISYSNLIVLADKDVQVIEHDNVNFGQELAKMPLAVDDNNKLAYELASSGLVPGFVTFHTKTLIKKNVMTMKIVGFDNKSQKV